VIDKTSLGKPASKPGAREVGDRSKVLEHKSAL
jgi:hypothetical protein